jgi:hypothetical protein
MDTKKTEVLPAYKGFDKDLKCRGFRYEIGKTYHHAGSVAVCASGFHACLNPLDVFNYYSPPSSKFCRIEAAGEIQRHHEDSKIASASITIQAEIKLPEIIKNAVSFVMGLVNASKTTTATTGESAHAATTGYYAHAATTGKRAHAATTGSYAHAATTGERAHAATTGDHAVACALGFASKAKASACGAIVLVCRNSAGELLHIRASKVGENGIKPDMWYSLDAQGNFVKADDE